MTKYQDCTIEYKCYNNNHSQDIQINIIFQWKCTVLNNSAGFFVKGRCVA